MVYLLTAFGHQPLGARDGVEGLAMLRLERPELVFLDIHMPAMDGYEFALQARADPVCHSIPLIAVTALAMAGDREKIYAQGFDGYISKPVAPETLLEILSRYFGQAPLSISALAQLQPPPGDPVTVNGAGPYGPLILFVDNSETNIRVARGALEPSGYEVVSAHSAAEGFEQARRRKPALIISDIHMPREDGFDFWRMIAADPELSHVPFLILTSSFMAERDRRVALLHGVKRFLTRPIAPERLLEEVEAALQKGSCE